MSAPKAAKLIHWYCKNCEKRQNTESTQTESIAIVNESVQTEPTIIFHESTQTESTQAFSTVCVCAQTHANLRVVGKCHMCSKYFHLYCIRTKEINGTVLCSSCNPEHDAVLSVTNSNMAQIVTNAYEDTDGQLNPVSSDSESTFQMKIKKPTVQILQKRSENYESFERKPNVQILGTERSTENDASIKVEENIPPSQRVSKRHNRLTKLSLSFKKLQLNSSSSTLSQK